MFGGFARHIGQAAAQLLAGRFQFLLDIERHAAHVGDRCLEAVERLREYLRHLVFGRIGGGTQNCAGALAFACGGGAQIGMLHAQCRNAVLRCLRQQAADVAGPVFGCGKSLFHQRSKSPRHRFEIRCLGIHILQQCFKRAAPGVERRVEARLCQRQFGGAGAERLGMDIDAAGQSVAILQRCRRRPVQRRHLRRDRADGMAEIFHAAGQRAFDRGQIIARIRHDCAERSTGGIELVEHLHQFARHFLAEARQGRHRLRRAAIQRLAQADGGMIDGTGQFDLFLADLLDDHRAAIFQGMGDHFADIGQFAVDLGPALGQQFDQHRALRRKQVVQFAAAASQRVVQLAAALAKGRMHRPQPGRHRRVDFVQAGDQRGPQIPRAGAQCGIQRLRRRSQQGMDVLGARIQRFAHRLHLLLHGRMEGLRPVGEQGIDMRAAIGERLRGRAQQRMHLLGPGTQCCAHDAGLALQPGLEGVRSLGKHAVDGFGAIVQRLRRRFQQPMHLLRPCAQCVAHHAGLAFQPGLECPRPLGKHAVDGSGTLVQRLCRRTQQRLHLLGARAQGGVQPARLAFQRGMQRQRALGKHRVDRCGTIGQRLRRRPEHGLQMLRPRPQCIVDGAGLAFQRGVQRPRPFRKHGIDRLGIVLQGLRCRSQQRMHLRRPRPQRLAHDAGLLLQPGVESAGAVGKDIVDGPG